MRASARDGGACGTSVRLFVRSFDTRRQCHPGPVPIFGLSEPTRVRTVWFEVVKRDRIRGLMEERSRPAWQKPAETRRCNSLKLSRPICSDCHAKAGRRSGERTSEEERKERGTPFLPCARSLAHRPSQFPTIVIAPALVRAEICEWQYARSRISSQRPIDMRHTRGYDGGRRNSNSCKF